MLFIKYLHSVRVQFGDGKIWDIDVGKSKLKDSPEAVSKIPSIYLQNMKMQSNI